MQELETGAWRGVIEDGELVEEHPQDYDAQRDDGDIEGATAGAEEDFADEDSEEPEYIADEPEAEADEESEDTEDEPEADEEPEDAEGQAGGRGTAPTGASPTLQWRKVGRARQDRRARSYRVRKKKAAGVS